MKRYAIITGFSPVNGYKLYHPKGHINQVNTAFPSEALTFSCELQARYYAVKTIGLKKVIVEEV